jgi:hypothetical protein
LKVTAPQGHFRASPDLNGHTGHQRVSEGTDAIFTLATESPEAGTGLFTDRFGPVRW